MHICTQLSETLSQSGVGGYCWKSVQHLFLTVVETQKNTVMYSTLHINWLNNFKRRHLISWHSVWDLKRTLTQVCWKKQTKWTDSTYYYCRRVLDKRLGTAELWYQPYLRFGSILSKAKPYQFTMVRNPPFPQSMSTILKVDQSKPWCCLPPIQALYTNIIIINNN